MRTATLVVLATLGFMAGTVVVALPRLRRGWKAWIALGLYFLALTALAGCGGGTLTADEIAQHEADMAALAALSRPTDSRKTLQPVNCAASNVCR